MSDKNTGGPAFPFAATDPSNVPMQDSGMSLRDWFAGQALSMVDFESATISVASNYPDESVADAIAELAFTVADAMLKRRGE